MSSAPSPSGHGFVDLSHRGVVAVTGDDRLSWLHLLVTQHMTDLPPGQATEALILSANGHIEHALYLVDDGETVWAHVEPGTREELVAYLESMKFFYRVEVADRTDDIAVVHLPAGSIAEVPEGAAVRETPHGRDLFLPRADLESFAASHGPAAGILAYEALRVEAHRPRLGFETDHRTIPHEVGLIGSAVHLQKGCYRGQETVARVQNLGKPPRRLVFLHLDGSEVLLPGHGTPIRLAADGEEGRRARFRDELRPPPRAGADRPRPGEAERAGGRPAGRRDDGGRPGDRRRAVGRRTLGTSVLEAVGPQKPSALGQTSISTVNGP